MAESFLDLMAFTRGAEFANDRNWADVFRDIQSRTQENALQQNQQVFDLNKPVAEAKVQDFMRGRDAGQAAARFSADVLREVSQQPVEAQGGLLAARLYGQLQQAKSPEEVSALYNFGKAQMAAALNRGDQAGALAIANSMPGQNMTEALKGHLNWGNPEFYSNPENVEAAGGKLQPDGTVVYGGTKIPLALFANIQRRLATNRATDQTVLLAPHAQRQQQLNTTQQWMEQFNPQFAQQGVQFVMGPNGQMMAVPMAPPQMALPGAMPQFAPAPGGMPLPAGVMPSAAGAGRGVVNPAPVFMMPTPAQPPQAQAGVQNLADIQAAAAANQQELQRLLARQKALSGATMSLLPAGAQPSAAWRTLANRSGGL